MPYTIEELTDDRNRNLVTEVLAQTQVTLEQSTDDSWGERTKEGSSTIYYNDTAHPVACFTHELLHIRLNLNGLARPGYRVRRKTQEAAEQLVSFVGEMFPFMYNELAHHRFYATFIEMGFQASEFLHDSDIADRDRVLREDLPKLADLHRTTRKDVPMKLIMPPYLFCSSLNDRGDAVQRARKELRKYSGGQTYRFDEVLKDWRNDPKPDVRVYLARLCRVSDLVDTGFGDDNAGVIWSSTVPS